MMRTVNISFLGNSRKTEFLDSVVKNNPGKFKILVDPTYNKLDIIGVEFESKEIAAEMKLSFL